MFSRKMNIASLPPEKVFLRAVDLPACEPEELLPMLEFQVEELSPLPMTQAVWSAEPVPRNRFGGPNGLCHRER